MLGNSLIIDLQKICVLMINDIENAILTQSFANLKIHLPDDITLDEVRELIDVHLVGVMKDQSDIYKDFNDGLLIIDENTAINVLSYFVNYAVLYRVYRVKGQVCQTSPITQLCLI